MYSVHRNLCLEIVHFRIICKNTYMFMTFVVNTEPYTDDWFRVQSVCLANEHHSFIGFWIVSQIHFPYSPFSEKIVSQPSFATHPSSTLERS